MFEFGSSLARSLGKPFDFMFSPPRSMLPDKSNNNSNNTSNDSNNNDDINEHSNNLSNMSQVDDRPIALRRSRRGSTGDPRTAASTRQRKNVELNQMTPSKPAREPRGKKRVRFSDPGPIEEDHDTSSSSTGLTPMVRRSTLGGLPPAKRRRHSTPLRQVQNANDDSPANTNNQNNSNNIIHFMSLRQVLDDRTRRRIRRNGLSEEMNTIDSEKRRRKAEQKAELERLRSELANKDSEIRRLRDTSFMVDADRIIQLEQEVEYLNSSLSEKSRMDDSQSEGSGWAPSSRGEEPFSDDFMDYMDNDAEDFGDTTMADFACSTPTKAREPPPTTSFPTPPDTSPSLPVSPFTFRQPQQRPATPSSNVSVQTSSPDQSSVSVQTPRPSQTNVSVQTPRHKQSNVSIQTLHRKQATAAVQTPIRQQSSVSVQTPHRQQSSSSVQTPQPILSSTSVQASMPDPEKESLEAELQCLRSELTRLSETLAAHEADKSRLCSKIWAASSVPENKDGVEGHLDAVLQSLSDRTAALMELNSSLSSLGFPGRDADEIIASLANAFRAARLELEYLTPGELTLPLSSRGAEVLDLVLARLRELARKSRDDDDAIDEYHALELSLRSQISARVDAMDRLNRELEESGLRLRERDDRIVQLEIGLDRLKGAVGDYQRDVAELEDLVQRLEADGGAKEARLRGELQAAQAESDAAKAVLARRAESVGDLEGKLAAALARIDALQRQAGSLRNDRAADAAALNKSHGRALALRDARVAELRSEVDAVNAGLRTAHETIRQLRVENATLAGQVEDEQARARDAVEAMKSELERVVHMSADLLSSPIKSRNRDRNRNRSSTAAGGEASSADGVAATSSPTFQEVEEKPVPQVTQPAKRFRRRYDSGLGFLEDEDEDGEDEEVAEAGEVPEVQMAQA